MNSIGASSLSPSPMATLPSNGTLSKVLRIASTAASSAAILSPLPRHFALAMAAMSTASRKWFERSDTLPMCVYGTDHSMNDAVDSSYSDFTFSSILTSQISVLGYCPVESFSNDFIMSRAHNNPAQTPVIASISIPVL